MVCGCAQLCSVVVLFACARVRCSLLCKQKMWKKVRARKILKEIALGGKQRLVVQLTCQMGVIATLKYTIDEVIA